MTLSVDWLRLPKDVWDIIIRFATGGAWYLERNYSEPDISTCRSWLNVALISSFFNALSIIRAYRQLSKCIYVLQHSDFFTTPGTLVCLPSNIVQQPRHVLRISCPKHTHAHGCVHVSREQALNYNYDLSLYRNAQHTCVARNTHPCMTLAQITRNVNDNYRAHTCMDKRVIIYLYHPLVHGTDTVRDMKKGHIKAITFSSYGGMTDYDTAIHLLCNVQYMFTHDTYFMRQQHRAACVLTYDTCRQEHSDPIKGMPPLVQITRHKEKEEGEG